MATKKISELPVAAALTGTEELPVVQAGATVKTTPNDLKADVVKTSGTQTIGGAKTFSEPPIVPAPTQAGHAVTKGYADGLASSAVTSGVRPAVKVVATTNQNIGLLSGTPTIDGYATTDGDRVLLTAQTTGSQNGIWLVNGVLGWSRPSDFAAGSNQAGATVFAAGGTTYRGSSWTLNSTGTVTVDTNVQTWVQDATKQPVDADLTAIAALATTSYGRDFLVLANEAAVRDKLDYATAGDAASAGSAATDALLKSWTTGDAYELLSMTLDADQVMTTATVKWPDGSGGDFTTTTINATHKLIDAYTVSHTLFGKTVTQAAVTRNAEGYVTTYPALTVA